MVLRTTRKRSNKAVSPAVSTVIITGVMVALITVALSFASNFLVIRMAESEFDSSKQFMQTLALQIDDVAWVTGRTETARYSGKYGDVTYMSALNYTIYTTTDPLPGPSSTFQKLYTSRTDIICFNMPVSHYSVGNNYFELIYPSSNNGFLFTGASAPVARIFAVEKLPMVDGSFARVVVVPAIRMLNLSLGDTNYVRLYLPILSEGAAPKRSHTVTLSGESVSKIGATVTGIKIEVSFPLAGFDNFFFQFSQTEELISLSGETVLELYIGKVDVALGVHA